MAGKKQIQQLARQLFQMSLADGRLSDERVGGVLAYIEKINRTDSLALLRSYRRLIAAEVARNQAVVEHAGAVSTQALQAIGSDLSRKYGRPISVVSRPDPALLAGLRVRVGDDVYESSVAGQLAQLSDSV